MADDVGVEHERALTRQFGGDGAFARSQAADESQDGDRAVLETAAARDLAPNSPADTTLGRYL